MRKTAVAAALAAALAPCASWALLDDRVELWAAENATHDSNVLRLSKSLNPLFAAPEQRDDTIYTTHVGATLNANFSQQHVSAEYTWYQSKYQYFKDFDFDGHTVLANWAWVLNPGAKGSLGYNESQGLASFANIQSRQPDVLTTRSLYATGNYLLTPRYRLSGALTGERTRHGSDLRKANDIDLESAEAGISYVTPLDNSVGVVTRYERGRLPNGVDLVGLADDNSYRQSGVGALTTWVFTGHSRFDGRVEWVQRKYDQGTARNYSGPIARALYTWTPTGKLTIAAALSRDVDPAQDIQTSFVLITGAYVRPRWNITDKITLQGNAEYNIWDYRGDPILGGGARHRVRLFGASVAYRPTAKILLQAGINREVRASNIAFADYDVNVVFIEGRIGF